MSGSTCALIDLENLDSMAGELRWEDDRPLRYVGNGYPPFFDLETLAELIRERFAPVETIKAFAHLNRFTGYEPVMKRAGVVPVDVPSVRQSKNAADIAMAFEAARCVYTCPSVSRLVIASHDSDFRPVAFALKAIGRRTVGLGFEEGNWCEEWVGACDEFVWIPQPEGWGHYDEPPDEEVELVWPGGYGYGRRGNNY